MKALKRFWTNGCWLVILGLLFLTIGSKVVLAANYEIKNFESEITLNQDYSLRIKETIETNFLIAKHGIYRVIPYIYSHKGKTIRANLKILNVTDENGLPIRYTVSNYNQSKKIQIGNPDKTIIGKKNYVIEYSVDQVVLDYGDGPEIYWNVTGKEWEVIIEKVKAKVISPYGDITKVNCFGCESSFDKNEADFNGFTGLTVAAQISKNNQLKMPGVTKRIKNLVEGNWGYLLAILPILLMILVWALKGRDKKYLSDNVYVKPEDQKETTVNPFDRPHLPLVYAPIKGLSPAEIGTILDQRVDIQDVVAEIIELARLGFLKIKKIGETKLFGIINADYELIKSENEFRKTEINLARLDNFQKDLLEALFKNSSQVKISDLRYKFYKNLPKLRSDMYEELNNKGISDGDWKKIQSKWVAIVILLNSLVIFLIIWWFMKETDNCGPLVLTILGLVPSIILAIKVPRRTAWGYSLYRQITGLKYYLGKGKWREEIMEKNLFLEEMLPIAISLGVVNQLSKDMQTLGIQPPSYFEGTTLNSFANDLFSFRSVTATYMVSTPTGNSSWSGGSGFSGGSSGGGFGGGGGGSW